MHLLPALTRRLRSEEAGFTLVELLVITIIIGTLAAISLAQFLGQEQKGHDASMKSDVSLLTAEMESCHVEQDDYAGCDEATDPELGRGGYELDTLVIPSDDDACPDPGFGIAPEPGKVGVMVSGDKCYVVFGTSKADDGGTSHIFMSRLAPDGTRERTCGPAAIRGKGGCPDDGTW